MYFLSTWNKVIHIIAIIVGEIYIRVIEVLSLLFLWRLLLRLLLRILQFFVCINRGLNDIVFHYVLFLEKSNLLLAKPNVDKVVFTIFVWIFKVLKSFLNKLKLVKTIDFNAAISTSGSCSCSDSLNSISWLALVSVEVLLMMVVFPGVSSVFDIISGLREKKSFPIDDFFISRFL